ILDLAPLELAPGMDVVPEGAGSAGHPVNQAPAVFVVSCERSARPRPRPARTAASRPGAARRVRHGVCGTAPGHRASGPRATAYGRAATGPAARLGGLL
ncbi:hypothetical protein ABT329_36755, partial [Streptomyces minutiscleroticus]